MQLKAYLVPLQRYGIANFCNHSNSFKRHFSPIFVVASIILRIKPLEMMSRMTLDFTCVFNVTNELSCNSFSENNVFDVT